MNFHLGEKQAVNQLLAKYHYKGFTKNSSMWRVCGSWHLDGGLWGDMGECVAGCVFAVPVRHSEENSKMMELIRLVRSDTCSKPLTGLIAQTVKVIKRKHPEVSLLISYADNNEHHYGGIYQAASWHYDGERYKRRAMIQFKDGRCIHSRHVHRLYGTSDPVKLARLGVPGEYVSSTKYFYWKPLNRRGRRVARDLNLKDLPYVKPKNQNRKQ